MSTARWKTVMVVVTNTAERVIDHVDCDVLVVKPAGFKARVKRSSVKV